MGAKAGVGLKFLQWFVRGIQFCCAALILAVFSYFLATLHNHDLPIDTWIRAVEGISGIAVVYTAIGLLLLCCLAGHPVTSFIAIVLDICFVGGFAYVASANRGGASSCNGIVNTPFGTGDSDTNVVDNGHGGFTALPSLHTACKLETACLAVSIIAIFFFIFSALLEFALVRHHRKEKRFGPGPANDYTSGYGKPRRGFFGFGRRNRQGTNLTTNTNALPEHTTPEQVRDSYATEQTRVGTSHADTGVTGTGYPKYGESGYGHEPGVVGTGLGHPAHEPVAPAHYPPGNYRYDDGVYNARTG